MRIPETDHTPRILPATGATQAAAPPSPTVSPSPVSIPLPASLSEHLSSLLNELGVVVTSAQREDLAGQFAALGFTSAEIDREGALRAVFLQRNSVTLTAALLKAPLSPESPALFHHAAALMEEALILLDSGGVTADARTAIEILARDLEAILRGNVPVSGWMGGMIRDKREESLSLSAQEWEVTWGNAEGGDDIGSILRKSGMAFEWRLLGWYRAGRDPSTLRDLLHGDLKGILFHFLRTIEKSQERASVTGKLEKSARSLLDSITANQVAHLLDDSKGKLILPLAVPAQTPEERMYAGVRVDGGNRQDDNVSGTEYFSLSLEVETTRLGPVSAKLRSSGKTVSVTFLLKDRRTLALAEEMADEFRGLMRERGYEPGVIRFTLASHGEVYPVGNTDSGSSLDIRG